MADDEIVWRRAASCDANGGSCVEVHHRPNGDVLVRESDFPADVLRLSKKQWDGFVTGIVAGDFDA
jgi:hypothetical protein